MKNHQQLPQDSGLFVVGSLMRLAWTWAQPFIPIQPMQVLWCRRFPGDDIPIVRGSALAALNGTNPELGEKAILALMDAVDEYVPTPQRALDKPFSMPVEDVFSIQVRDTHLC